MRYDRWFLPFSVPFGLGPKHSAIGVEDDKLHSASAGFRTEIALASIKDAKPNNDRVYARAYVMGVPIKLRTLYVSVTNPQELIEACAPTVV